MTDFRFYKPLGPFTVAHLAKLSGSDLLPGGNPEQLIENVAPLSRAGQGDLSFLDNRKYLSELHTSAAGAVVMLPEYAAEMPKSMTVLCNPKPYKAFALIAQAFYPIRYKGGGFISPHAIIDETATIGDNCYIEAGVVIGPDVRIGQHVKIGANTTIEAAVEIGDETIIGTSVSLSQCIIGQRVRILPGARIGQEGFGFAMDPAGHVRIPQLGRVLIEDDVEIGANTTIDRGAGPDTIIGRSAMIDNLVQIAHNVVIGPGSVIAAQAGVSGSSKIGPGVMIAGQVGIAGHLTIGAGAQIAGNSGIMRDVEPKARMMGYPAVTMKRFFRQIVWLEKMVSSDGKKND